MNKKYKLLPDRYIDVDGKRLYQIQALRNFGDTRAGDLGGFIQSEHNLSHEGSAWVLLHGRVLDRATVSGDALIGGATTVCEDAKVSGQATTMGASRISGQAIVHEDALISDGNVSGNARVNCAIINDTITTGGTIPGPTRIDHKKGSSQHFRGP